MLKYLNYLTILLLPTYLIKLPLFYGASLNILDILLLLSIFINILLIKERCHLVTLFLKSPFAIILSGFFLALLFNYDSATALDSLGVLKSFLVLPLIFSFTIAFLMKKKVLELHFFLLSLFFSSTSLAILGFIFIFTEKLSYDHRLSLFYNSPNSLAIILSVGILIGIYYLHKNKDHKPLFNLILLSLLFHFISLLATASSGSFLSLFSLTLLLLVQRCVFPKKNIFLFAALGAVLFSISLLFLGTFLSFTAYSAKTPPTSTDSRVIIYTVTSQILSRHFLLGIGPDNFQSKYLSYQIFNPPYPQWAVPHPHNNFLLLFIEGGILSAFGFVLLFLKLFPTKKTSLGLLLSLIFLYFLLHGIFDTTLWKNDLAVIFWSIVSLLFFNQSKNISSNYLNDCKSQEHL